MMTQQITIPLPISKWMVYNSYLEVVAMDGNAAIDRQSIEKLHENLPANLDKIWKHMISGSYFPPPVKREVASRKQRARRPLGIPTVSDRIAQGVVKDYLEPYLEKVFHPGSFGYRPGRSAYDATLQYQENCMKYEWMLDVNVPYIFDNIRHDILLKLLQEHTQEKWILLYAQRWLKAGMQQDDGSIAIKKKGIPGGGVISPLFANIYLHHCFDTWMEEENGQNPFERYGDEIIIHCTTREQAIDLLEKLKARMQQYALQLPPESTAVASTKNYQRNGRHEKNGFAFSGNGFQPSTMKDNTGRKNWLPEFNAPITNMLVKLKSLFTIRWINQT